MKPDHFRTYIFGDVQPRLRTLSDTHTKLGTFAADNMEKLFAQMQGEVWSPNGEARNLIRGLGLRHTSMSVGDVVHNVSTGEYHVVANYGFDKLEVEQ